MSHHRDQGRNDGPDRQVDMVEMHRSAPMLMAVFNLVLTGVEHHVVPDGSISTPGWNPTHEPNGMLIRS
ncbi:hypothetical protein IMZ48_11040 [Candidatus Bathyarchaeota archaeon]|nr:hypothetical protein [Candidatus Bathyarchaeota archaeon]